MSQPPEPLSGTFSSPIVAIKSIKFHDANGAADIEFLAHQTATDPAILVVLLPSVSPDEPTDSNSIVVRACSELEDRLKQYLEEIANIRESHKLDT